MTATPADSRNRIKEQMNRGFTKDGRERQRCQCRMCGRFNCGDSVNQCGHWQTRNGSYSCPTYPCRECYLAGLDAITP